MNLVSTTIFSVALVALLIHTAGLAALLYHLDKLRYGDDMQIVDLLLIAFKVLATLITISQLWLYHAEGEAQDYAFLFFLGGALLLFIFWRGSFEQVQSKDETALFSAALSALAFGSGACMAGLFYATTKPQSNAEICTMRFWIFVVAAFTSLLVVALIVLYQSRSTATQIDELEGGGEYSRQADLLPSTLEGVVMV
jgi:hypothetical protein